MDRSEHRFGLWSCVDLYVHGLDSFQILTNHLFHHGRVLGLRSITLEIPEDLSKNRDTIRQHDQRRFIKALGQVRDSVSYSVTKMVLRTCDERWKKEYDTMINDETHSALDMQWEDVGISVGTWEGGRYTQVFVELSSGYRTRRDVPPLLPYLINV